MTDDTAEPRFTAQQMIDLASVYEAQTLVKDDRTAAMLRQGAAAVQRGDALRDAVKSLSAGRFVSSSNMRIGLHMALAAYDDAAIKDTK